MKRATARVLNAVAPPVIITCLALWAFCLLLGDFHAAGARFEIEYDRQHVQQDYGFISPSHRRRPSPPSPPVYNVADQQLGLEWGELTTWSGRAAWSFHETGVRARVLLISAAWPVAATLIAAPLAVAWLDARHRSRRRRLGGDPTCPECGYDCRTTTAGRCPECGTAVPCLATPEQWRAASRALPRAGRAKPQAANPGQF